MNFTSRKKLILIFVTVLLVLSVTGCVNGANLIYDNETKLAADYNTFSITDRRQNHDGQFLTCTIGRFEGMFNLWTYKAAEETDLDIEYFLNVSGGEAKLVLIGPDDTITTLVEVTPETGMENAQTATLHLQAGKNRIKVVGRHSNGVELTLSIPEGEWK